MSIFDIALLAIIGGFGLFGFWFGLIHTVGSLVGTLVGVFVATRYYEPAADWLTRLTGWSENVSNVIVFIVLFFIINRLVGFLFWLVDRLLRFITRLPFIGGLNRLLGLVAGLAEGAIVLGIVFYFIARFPVGETFMEWVGESAVVPPLVKFVSWLLPLVPEGIRALRSTVEGVI